jgi:hypothetical protein
LPVYAGEKHKENFMKHVRTVLVVLVLSFVVMGCATTATTSQSLTEAHSGFVRDIAIPAKDFEIIGLVFHEAVVENGNNGERLTYYALLRAAEQRGGNGIVNVMIDVRRERLDTTTTSMTRGGSSTVTFREIWYGTALAIRYTTTVQPETPISTGGRALSGSTGGSGDGGGGGVFGGLFGGR